MLGASKNYSWLSVPRISQVSPNDSLLIIYFLFFCFQLVTNLTSSWYGDSIRKRIDSKQMSTDPKWYGAVFYNQEDHGTAHVSVISPDGDAVSVTSTVNL